MVSLTYTMRIILDLVNRQVSIVDFLPAYIDESVFKEVKQSSSGILKNIHVFKNMYNFVNASDGCCRSGICSPFVTVGGILYISSFI